MWADEKKKQEIKKAVVLNITWVIEQVVNEILECEGGYVSCGRCPYNFLCPTARFYLE